MRDSKDILSRLHGVKGRDGQWTAKCPAHDDRQNSLSIGLGDDGRVLLHCHAGCSTSAILNRLGLQPKDLFPERKEYTEQLRGVSVFVLPDNDGIGREYASEVCSALNGVAKSVQLLGWNKLWPEVPEKGDISDYIQKVGAEKARDALMLMTVETPEWKMEAQPVPQEPSQLKHDRKPRLCLDILDSWLSEHSYTIKLNVITREVEISGISNEFNPETMADDLPVILHDSLKYEYQCSKDTVADLLKLVAGRHRYNPVVDMLNSTTWDGKDRISEVFDILGIQSEDKLSQTLVWKWLCQCVALAGNEYSSAFGADGMLVLQGPQGIGKTSFVRTLGVRPELVKLGQYIDTKDKDTTRRCTSAWIVELGEVETTLRSDLERLKAFVTAERDEYRLPYGRADQKLVRRTSLIATCNSERFLIDPTGSRRFWTVPVEHIDLDLLSKFDSLQLWAEIKQMVERNKQWFRLTREEQEQLAERNAAHEKPIKAQIEVEDILSEATSSPSAYIWRDDTVSAFKEAYDSLRNYSAEQIGRALDKVGLEAQRKKVSGSVKKVRNLPFKNYGAYSVVGCG